MAVLAAFVKLSSSPHAGLPALPCLPAELPYPCWCLLPAAHAPPLPACLPARPRPQGKEDCVRKAYRGVDVVADLHRTCPALSLQQVGTREGGEGQCGPSGIGSRGCNAVVCAVAAACRVPAVCADRPPATWRCHLPLQVYKLTEHQHDDWIVGEWKAPSPSRCRSC